MPLEGCWKPIELKEEPKVDAACFIMDEQQWSIKVSVSVSIFFNTTTKMGTKVRTLYLVHIYIQ